MPTDGTGLRTSETWRTIPPCAGEAPATSPRSCCRPAGKQGDSDRRPLGPLALLALIQSVSINWARTTWPHGKRTETMPRCSISLHISQSALMHPAASALSTTQAGPGCKPCGAGEADRCIGCGWLPPLEARTTHGPVTVLASITDSSDAPKLSCAEILCNGLRGVGPLVHVFGELAR